MDGQLHALATLPTGKTQYPLYRMLGRPQGRSGRVCKISPSLGFDPRTVQPVGFLCASYINFLSPRETFLLSPENTFSHTILSAGCVFLNFYVHTVHFYCLLFICVNKCTRARTYTHTHTHKIILQTHQHVLVPLHQIQGAWCK